MKLSERKKQQILMAAVATFDRHGFAATSMDAIAEAAAVSKRTVYNHFASKDELFSGIVSHMFGMLAEASPPTYQSNQEFRSQLTQIARQKVSLLLSDEFLSLSRVVIPEAIHHPEKMEAALTQMTSVDSDLHRWFRDAIADGKLNESDPEKVSQTFTGLLKMDSYWPCLLRLKNLPGGKELDLIVENAVELFSRCYLIS